MKQLFYFLPLVAMLLSGNAIAQGLSVTPGNLVTVSGDVSNSELVADALVTNNTGQAITLVWERQTNNLNSAWKSLVCDKNLCYGATTSTAMVSLAAGESSILNIHFKLYGTPGNGTVVVRAYSQNDPSIMTEITYEASASAVGINNNLATQMKFYPMPAADALNINFGNVSNVKYVELYSVVGEHLQSYYIPTGQNSCKIPTDYLSAGMYFVRLLNDSRQLIGSKAFPKVN